MCVCVCVSSQLGEKVALIARLEEDLLESRRAWGNEQGNGEACSLTDTHAQAHRGAFLSFLVSARPHAHTQARSIDKQAHPA